MQIIMLLCKVYSNIYIYIYINYNINVTNYDLYIAN